MYKNQGPYSRYEKVKTLMSPFRDRPKDIVAKRGALSSQKKSPRVHWILRRLHKNKNLYKEIRKLSNKIKEKLYTKKSRSLLKR